MYLVINVILKNLYYMYLSNHFKFNFEQNITYLFIGKGGIIILTYYFFIIRNI